MKGNNATYEMSLLFPMSECFLGTFMALLFHSEGDSAK